MLKEIEERLANVLKRHLNGTLSVLFLTALIVAATAATIQSNQISVSRAISSITVTTLTTTETTVITTVTTQTSYNGGRIDVLIERLETRNQNLANNLRADQEIRTLLENAPYTDDAVAWFRITESTFKRISEASRDAELKGISLQISEISGVMLRSIEDVDEQEDPNKYVEQYNVLGLLLFEFDARFKYLLDRDLTEAAQALEQT